MTNPDLQARLKALSSELDDLDSSDDGSPLDGSPRSAVVMEVTSPQNGSTAVDLAGSMLDKADQLIEQSVVWQSVEMADPMLAKQMLDKADQLIEQSADQLIEQSVEMAYSMLDKAEMLDKADQLIEQSVEMADSMLDKADQVIEHSGGMAQPLVECDDEFANMAKFLGNMEVNASWEPMHKNIKWESAVEHEEAAIQEAHLKTSVDHEEVVVQEAHLEPAADQEEAAIQEARNAEIQLETETDILPSDLARRAAEVSVARVPPALLAPVARSASVDHSQSSQLVPRPPPRVGGVPRAGARPRRQQRTPQPESSIDPSETFNLRRREKLGKKAPVPEAPKQRKLDNARKASQQAEYMENKEQLQPEEQKEPRWFWRQQSQERQQRIQTLQDENQKKKQRRERRERRMQQDRDQQQSQCSFASSGEFSTSRMNDSSALATRAAHLEDEVAQIDRRLAEAEAARQESLAQSAMAQEKMGMLARQSRSASRSTTPGVSVCTTLPESIIGATDTAADRVREWKRRTQEEMKRAEREEAERLENRRGRHLPLDATGTVDPNVYDGKSLCVWCGDVAGPGHEHFCVLRPAKCQFCGMKLAAVQKTQHEVNCPERTDGLVYNIAPPCSYQQRGRHQSRRSDPRCGGGARQRSRSGSRAGQLSRCGSAASVRSTSSVSSRRQHQPGSETSRRFRAETPQRSRPQMHTPRRNPLETPQGSWHHPKAPQTPRVETPRRRPQQTPRRYRAETPQRTPQQSPRHRRLEPLEPLPVGSLRHGGVPFAAHQPPDPSQGYFNPLASTAGRMRPTGQAQLPTPRRAMPNGAHLPPIQVPPSPCGSSRNRPNRSHAGSAACSRATTPRLSRPLCPTQPQAQATPRVRRRQAGQTLAESPCPGMRCPTKDELTSNIQSEREQYISQKLSGASTTGPTVLKGTMLSADAPVPTKEELRMQMQKEREEFILRRAREMANSESIAAF